LLTAGTAEANAVGNLTANFSEGINRVSEQIPTVLLIAAIVLIIGVLAVLVGVWQRMRMGGGSL
jgi:multisubunit Na+/H+ antiporter MnhC subunit